MSSIVYIDGQNFLYKVSDVLENAGIISNKQELTAIDIPFILKQLFPDEKLEIRYYSIKKIHKQENYGEGIKEKSIQFANNLRKIRSCLDKTGVLFYAVGQLKVRDRDECKKCGATDYKFQEKGVDVGLAVDIVKDVLMKRTDKVILLSSDTDIKPAIKIAKNVGAKISYVGFQNALTLAYSRFANETKAITPTMVIEAFTRAQKA